jgi:hypothetical protein
MDNLCPDPIMPKEMNRIKPMNKLERQVESLGMI